MLLLVVVVVVVVIMLLVRLLLPLGRCPGEWAGLAASTARARPCAGGESVE